MLGRHRYSTPLGGLSSTEMTNGVKRHKAN